MTSSRLSRIFLGLPFHGRRFTHYLAVDVSGLRVVRGRAGVYAIPNAAPLDVTDRIRDHESNCMRYLKVAWRHDRADEPVLLFSECDDEGWEVRKVEMFRDGRIGYAGGLDSAGGTVLGERPTPDLAEITNQAEFDPTLITRREFEKVWSAARARLSLATSH